jgi:predicted nucleic acid-binding protein
MTETTLLVDSNVFLDLMDQADPWHEWSLAQCTRLKGSHHLAINPMIYAEIAFGFSHQESLERALDFFGIEQILMPFKAAFFAAQCHRRYRQAGGLRSATLPDFFIGAHAAVEGFTLITRDRGRYETYFPSVKLIAPEP